MSMRCTLRFCTIYFHRFHQAVVIKILCIYLHISEIKQLILCGGGCYHVCMSLLTNQDSHAVKEERINTATFNSGHDKSPESVSYTHLRAHETDLQLVCRLLLE